MIHKDKDEIIKRLEGEIATLESNALKRIEQLEKEVAKLEEQDKKLVDKRKEIDNILEAQKKNYEFYKDHGLRNDRGLEKLNILLVEYTLEVLDKINKEKKNE
jgi:hypothetical protein